MNVTEVAQRFIDHCKRGEDYKAVDELYSPNVVSVEPLAEGMDPAEGISEGLDAIRAKHAWWEDNHEIHEAVAEGPYLGRRPDEFLVKFIIDVTPKGGERVKMEELGQFTVADGKVVREEFLHIPG